MFAALLGWAGSGFNGKYEMYLDKKSDLGQSIRGIGVFIFLFMFIIILIRLLRYLDI
jgi:hypothetical protein